MTAHLVHRKGPAPPFKSYADYALEAWRKNPKKLAVIEVDTDEQLTFEQFEFRVTQFAGFLQQIGVKSQTKVQFFCKNSLDSLIAQQASFLCNATTFVYKINDSVKYQEYKFQSEDAEVEYVLTDSENYDIMVHQYVCDPECSAKKAIIVHGTPKRSTDNDKVILVKKLSGNSFVKPINVDIKTDILIVSYTSGSTGLPKGVMHNNQALVASLHTIGQLGVFEPSDRFLLMSYLTYVTGTIFSAGSLANGITLILAHHDHDANLPILAEKYKVTSFFLLECPMRIVVDNAHEFPNLKEMVQSIRVVLFGGTVFSEQLRNKIKDIFEKAKFINGYGQTESWGFLTFHDATDEPTLHIGTVCSDIQMRVVRDDGSPVNVGEPGEIQWDGVRKTLGYWKRKCTDYTEDGYLATGDIGTIDEQGNLTIVDRKKHIIICLDERVAPMEIEEVLLNHSAVHEVVVVAVPDAIVKEAPTAMVIVKEEFKKAKEYNEDGLRRELVALVASKMSDFKQLHGGVHFVDQLDKTDSGKYARVAITRRALKLSGITSEN